MRKSRMGWGLGAEEDSKGGKGKEMLLQPKYQQKTNVYSE
jgi:hypothetical protein